VYQPYTSYVIRADTDSSLIVFLANQIDIRRREELT